MHRGGALVRWVGMIAILLSLFAPFVTADVGAQEVPSDPEVTLVEEGTPAPPEPTAEPTPDPTLAPEPTAEPTAPPTAEPASEPTPEPTAEPTIEQTVAPEPTSEPTAMPALQSRGAVTSASQPNPRANLAITFIPGSPLVIAGTPVDVIVRVSTTTSNVDIFSLQLFMPAAPGTRWTATPVNGECDADLFCWPEPSDPLEPTAEFEVRLTSPTTAATCGTHGFQVDAYGSQGLAQASNSFTVLCVPNVNIAVSGPASTTLGDTLAYDITVTNSGSAPATNVSLASTLPTTVAPWTVGAPSGTAPMTCTGGGIDPGLACQIPTLAPGQTSSVTVQATARASACGSTISFLAHVTTPQQVTSNTVTTTVACPNVSIALNGPARTDLGTSASYTATVTNSGTVQANNVTFEVIAALFARSSKNGVATDPQQPGMQCEWVISTTNRCSGITLAPGASASVAITVTPPSEVRECDASYVVGSWLRGDLTGESSASTTLVCHPDVSVSIDGPASITPGETLWYDITLTNTGLGAAKRIAMYSTLSDMGGTWSVASAPSGSLCGTASQGSPYCSFIDVPAQTGSVTIRVEGVTLAESRFCNDVTATAWDSPGGEPTSITTTVICEPDLALSVTGTAAAGLDEAISYTFTVTNSGLGAANDASFESQLPDTGHPWTPVADNPQDCSVSGNLLTCGGLVVGADGGSRSVSVLGTVGSDASMCDGLTVSASLTGASTGASNTVETRIDCIPGVGLAKTVTAIDGAPVDDFDGEIVLGTEITYSLLATNTGNITLTGVTVTDPLAGIAPGDCTVATLARGDSLHCEATSTIAQEDVDRGSFANTATVTGTATNGVGVSATADATVQVSQHPSLALTAQGTYAEPSAGAPLGSVAYTFTVVNDGTTTLTGVTLGEAPGGLGLALACAIGDTPAEQPATLAPGASLACAASHTVTQPEMDGGSLVTTAQTDSDQTAAASAPAAVSLPRTPGITIASRATNIPANGYDRFDVVHYAYEVENTGNVTLQDVTVTDTVRSIHIDCGIPGVDLKDIIPALAPGEAATCDGTYMVVQEDVEAGSFANTARVTANAPRGTDPATVSASANGSVPTDNTPGLTLQNNAYEGSRLLPGQTVTFAMIATNGGKVALTGVEITSSVPGLSGLTCDMSGTPATQPVTLQRGEMVRCTATYTVTQDDFDRGSITNEASVSGTYGEITVDDAATATLDDRGTRDPRVELTTTASQLVGVTAGTDITLTYQVRNTGNVTLRNLTVTEDTPGMSTIDCGDGGNVIATLAPNTPAVTCTTTLTITQAMIDGYVPRDSGDFGWILTTTARVTADAPAGMTPAQVSGEGSVSIFGLRLVVVDLVTTVTHVDGAPVAAGEPVTGLTAGQVVTFALTATNTGHVTLNDVRITDTALGALDCPGSGSATLAPGEAVRCTGTLEITQGLFDTDPDRRAETRGRVTAQDPQSNAVSDVHGVVVPLAPVAPVLDLAASVAPDTVDAPGDVTVTLTITNDGNVTLGNVVVPEHPVLDVARLDCDPDTEGAQAMIGTLPVGADVTCTVPFGIGQEQIDAGADITITVRAAADPAAFARVFSKEASATVGIDQKPDVAITNTVVGETTDLELGTTVTHAIAVTNTGNVTLGGVTVSDDAVSNDCLGWSPLAPGETVTCSVTGVITEADILAGELTTTAVVTAIAPDGTELRREGAATVTTVAPAPALSIAKGAASADGMLGPDATVRLGDAFVYTFLVKNTGNVTITDVVIEDAMLSGAGVAIPAIGDLAPGESRTVEAPWTVGAADVEAGSIMNEAVATGKDHSGEGVTSAPGSSILTVAQHQDLEVTTEISTPEGGIREGTVLGLTITVTNTGDVTIRGIELTSDLAGLTWDEAAARSGLLAFAQTGAGRTVGDLAPGEAATVSATYTVTADDVAAGVIRGSVVAAGTGPGGGIITDQVEITLAVDHEAPEPGATPPVPPATTPVTPADPAAITPEATSTPPAPLVVTGLPSTGASGGASVSLAPWLLVAAGALAVGASALGMRRRAGR
ncbi:MAG TPA: hypothetical protein VM450_01330 [Thermomicrobiales bacterium]|nr:hypothetical protein [Thermomicrobiales bacterium]